MIVDGIKADKQRKRLRKIDVAMVTHAVLFDLKSLQATYPQTVFYLTAKPIITTT